MKRTITRRQFIQTSSAVAVGALVSKKALAARDSKIVRAAIYPAIGVARVGNSKDPDGYFIGPERVNPPLTPMGFSRDRHGAIKRQAARFRVYGYNKAGNVVRELTAKNSDITWSVQLANKKAQWYRFVAALDIDETEGMRNIRRNKDEVGDAAREKLAITPKPMSISGKDVKGPEYRMKGDFQGTPVELGEVRTDRSGRLLVLGGFGRAGSPKGLPIFKPGSATDPGDPDSFNNADGWFDDSSDGTIDAVVTIDGAEVPVEGAWVIVAPPNFAPDIVGFRTLYDLLTHVYADAGWLEKPTSTSFTKDVLPLLQRLSNLQWVNQGFAIVHGVQKPPEDTEAAPKALPPQKPYDFQDPKLITKLNSKKETKLREEVYARFRIAKGPRAKNMWPMMYGDSYGTVQDSTNEDFFCPEYFRVHLENWVKGEYSSDWKPSRNSRLRKLSEIPKNPLDQVPEGLDLSTELQPDSLTEAALTYCLADAFHPGCELTWPMRHISMYSSPFRIKRRPENKPERDYGDELTEAICLSEDGPLQGQSPGSLSRWMAIPWHGDTAFCRSGYDPDVDPYLPTFWPARVPNQVLSADAYKLLNKPKNDKETKEEKDEKWAAFSHRENWFRNLSRGPVKAMEDMVDDFQRMGVIEAAELPEGGPFPTTVFVEHLPTVVAAASPESVPKSFTVRSMEAKDDPYRRAGWSDKEEHDEYKSIRVRKTWKK